MYPYKFAWWAWKRKEGKERGKQEILIEIQHVLIEHNTILRWNWAKRLQYHEPHTKELHLADVQKGFLTLHVSIAD